MRGGEDAKGFRLDVSEGLAGAGPSCYTNSMDVEELIKANMGWLFFTAKKFRSNYHAVEDLAQEGAIAMWKAFENFDGRGEILGWMRKNALWKMMDLINASDRMPSDLRELATDGESLLWDHLSVDGPDTPLSIHFGEVNQAVMNLTPWEHKYIKMRFWDEATTKEMQSVLGSGCHSAWRRAKLKLHRQLRHLKELV